MVIYKPMSDRELSQRKLEEYDKMSKVVNWGRSHPVKFCETAFGLKLIDYQSYVFMMTWATPFDLWLECRGAGKDTLAAAYFQTRLLLIPDYSLYVSSNTYAQSVESFNKLRDIALKRIPSFKSATDIFAREVDRTGTNSETGFLQAPTCKFRLYNNSKMEALSSNLEAIRGKRGAVWFNEVGWLNEEALAIVENFINVDSSFSTSTKKFEKIDPLKMPLQLLYTSSASDVTYPFFDKYKSFAKKMILGDRNYFCCDIDAYDILHHSTIDGEKIKSHLSEDQIQKAVEEDSERAERELFNKFRKGSGNNAIVSMDTLIRNSEIRKPVFYNKNSKDKFLLFYDPARNYDNSALTIWQLIEDSDIGYYLELVNSISMVDTQSTKKTPLPMPMQLEIIKEQMIRYNGEKAAEWENIELYIDSGAGGGGISAIADQLMEDWYDSKGKKHRGVIDKEHKQYETARKKYVNAVPIVHLIDPQGYKKIMYDALQKMTSLDLMKFFDYDNKDYLMMENEKGEFEPVALTFEERLALVNSNIMKTEISYMCRYETANGNVQYELARDKQNTMHDDFAYTSAMAAYALSQKRRYDLVTKPKTKIDLSHYKSLSRKPTIAR